jgi:hypothetical protein
MTSVSLDPAKIADFGPQLYKAIRPKVDEEHSVMEHDALIAELRRVALASDKDEKARAIQAIRYATRRREGLIKWKFDISSIPRKDLITWAYAQVQQYFTKS